MSAMYKSVGIYRKHDGKYLGTIRGRNALEFEVWLGHGVGVAVLTPATTVGSTEYVTFTAKDSLVGNHGAFPSSSIVTGPA